MPIAPQERTCVLPSAGRASRQRCAVRGSRAAGAGPGRRQMEPVRHRGPARAAAAVQRNPAHARWHLAPDADPDVAGAGARRAGHPHRLRDGPARRQLRPDRTGPHLAGTGDGAGRLGQRQSRPGRTGARDIRPKGSDRSTAVEDAARQVGRWGASSAATPAESPCNCSHHAATSICRSGFSRDKQASGPSQPPEWTHVHCRRETPDRTAVTAHRQRAQSVFSLHCRDRVVPMPPPCRHAIARYGRMMAEPRPDAETPHVHR